VIVSVRVRLLGPARIKELGPHLTQIIALRALNPSLLAIGHGEALGNPGEAIESARKAFC
jgi:hypothetical protein